MKIISYTKLVMDFELNHRNLKLASPKHGSPKVNIEKQSDKGGKNFRNVWKKVLHNYVIVITF